MYTPIEALQWRYATKQFDTLTPLTDEEYALVLESLRLSPSSFGLQPWKFVVVKNQELREALRVAAWNQPQITDADLLIVLCTPTSITEQLVDDFIASVAATRGLAVEDLAEYAGMMKNFISNTSQDGLRAWAKNQAYIALGTTMTTAAVAGIDTCPMEGFDRIKCNELLNLKSRGLESCVILTAGHRAPNDHYAQMKKVRYPADEIIVELK